MSNLLWERDDNEKHDADTEDASASVGVLALHLNIDPEEDMGAELKRNIA